jgi:hypothetical protein
VKGITARAALVFAALAAALLPLPSAGVERWYSQGLYPRLQAAMTPLANLVPFALFDVLIVITLAVVVAVVWARVRRLGVVRGLAAAAARLVVIAALVYLGFAVMWGFNYRRPPLEERLRFDASRVTATGVAALAREAGDAANALSATARAPSSDRALWDAFVGVHPAVGVRWTPRQGVPKRSLLQLYFRYAAIDGLTDPFFLEIVLNPDLLPFERPYVLAHEWAHLSGHADEAEASYVAWLACMNADPSARYSAWLAVYAHAAGQLPREERRALAAALGEGPRADLRAAAARNARAAPALTRVARESYDVYLRANRVDEGIESYDGVIRLILGISRDAGPAPHARQPSAN